jgi:Spy/CpxP family protein refolding chaperone
VSVHVSDTQLIAQEYIAKNPCFFSERKDLCMATPLTRMIMAIVILTGAVSIFSTVSHAQRMRMSVEEQVKILKDSLQLNDEQGANITKILEDQREEMTTTMGENRNNREAMRGIMQDLIKKTDEKIKKMLTEGQTKKYEEMMKTRRERMGQRMKGSGKP